MKPILLELLILKIIAMTMYEKKSIRVLCQVKPLTK